ncbi:MbtH family NRPS accessory protein [Nocardia sp. NPDC049220]|uniref:MbtH family protein n=1 Tax=Nocardia sp. NPDC049220 TaxID=3155273 RepID=UPI00340D9F61
MHRTELGGLSTLLPARWGAYRAVADPRHGLDEFDRTAAHFLPSMSAAFRADRTTVCRTALRSVFASLAGPPAALAQRLRVLPSSRSHTVYGPTKAAHNVAFHEASRTDALSASTGASEFPIRPCVLDSRLWPVSVEVPGELYLSGVQLARGSAARFWSPAALIGTDLFGADGRSVGDRTHRTRHPARRRAHRGHEYIRSADFPIRLGGRRIERAEIEAVRATVDSVARDVVVPRCDDAGDGEQLGAEVLDHRRIELGHYFCTLDGNGSVATQIAHRPDAGLNCPLGVRELRTATTVGALAELGERVGGSGGASLVAQLRARPRPPLVPLSPAQQHRRFRSRFERTSASDDILAEIASDKEFPRVLARAAMTVHRARLGVDDAEAIVVELPELSVATSTLDTGVPKFDLQLTVARNHAATEHRTVTTSSAGAGLGEGPAPAGIPAQPTHTTDLLDESAIADQPRGPTRVVDAITGDRDTAVLDLCPPVGGERDSSTKRCAQGDRSGRHRLHAAGGAGRCWILGTLIRLGRRNRMNNPFDDDAAKFYVLINAEGEHSLWPVFVAVPDGWTIAFGAAHRKSCLRYAQTHWVDPRPVSLIETTPDEAN